MLGTHFYHETIRKQIAVFGTLFNDIWIVRDKSDDTEHNRFKVPLAYGPKQMWLARIQQQPSFDSREVQIILPRIGYVLTGVSYDPERQLDPQNQVYYDKDSSTKYTQFVSVPFNFSFDLSVIVKHVSDGFQIVEQILYYFAKEMSITYNAVPSMGITEDLKMMLESVSTSDNFEGDFIQRRETIWDFSFVVHGNLYGPVGEQSLIRRVQVDFLNVDGVNEITAAHVAETPRNARIIVVPDPIDADPDDVYTINTTYYEYDDGKKFNPETGVDEDIS